MSTEQSCIGTFAEIIGSGAFLFKSNSKIRNFDASKHDTQTQYATTNTTWTQSHEHRTILHGNIRRKHRIWNLFIQKQQQDSRLRSKQNWCNHRRCQLLATGSGAQHKRQIIIVRVSSSSRAAIALFGIRRRPDWRCRIHFWLNRWRTGAGLMLLVCGAGRNRVCSAMLLCA